MKIGTAGLTSLVTIAVLSVAGCGGGDDDKGPSKEEFIAQADAICEKADKEQTAVPGKQSQGIYGNFSDTAYLSQYNGVTRDALKRLRALEAPEGDQKAVNDVLSALDQSVEAVDRRIAALKARDLPGQSQAMRDFQTSYGDVVASSGALGLTQCQALGN
jgi:hypothetical protein